MTPTVELPYKFNYNTMYRYISKWTLEFFEVVLICYLVFLIPRKNYIQTDIGIWYKTFNTPGLV